MDTYGIIIGLQDKNGNARRGITGEGVLPIVWRNKGTEVRR